MGSQTGLTPDMGYNLLVAEEYQKAYAKLVPSDRRVACIEQQPHLGICPG